MASASSPSAPSTTSPSKNPIASFSREKLEKLFQDSVKKLRAKDKELASLAAERDALAKQVSQESSMADHDIMEAEASLRTQMQRAEAQAAAATAQANEAQKELRNTQEKLEAASSRASAMAEDNDALLEQLAALKDQLRAMAEARDAELQAATAPLKSQLEERTETALRMESMVRGARQAAGKADAHCQVIDGALAATKAQLEKLEAEKEAWEAHVSQMQSEHEAEVSSLSHQLATLHSGLAEAAHAAPGEPSEIMAVKAELISLQEASRLSEDALLAEIDQLKQAAAAREGAVGEKVRSTQAALDAVLPELEESNRALAASVEEGAARAKELTALLREREAQVQDLEGRIAKTEAALNTAASTVEEREARIAALEAGAQLAQTDSLPDADAASLSTPEASSAKEADAADVPSAQLLPQAEDTLEASNAAIAPGLPDISEKQRSAADAHSEQIEQLESYVQQLERENEGLQQAVLQAQQQAQSAQQPYAEEVEALKARLATAERVREELEAQLQAKEEALAGSAGLAEHVKVLQKQLDEATAEHLNLGGDRAAAEANGEASVHQERGDAWEAEKLQLLQEKEQLVQELAETKRRFTAAAKRKQADFAKRVKEMEEDVRAAEHRAAQGTAELSIAQAAADAASQASSDNKNAEAASATAARDAALRELQAAQEEVAALKQQVQGLQSELAAAREAATAAEAKLQEGSETSSHSEREIARLNDAVESGKAGLTREKERAARFIMDLKKRLEKATKELKKAEEEGRDAELSAAEVRGKLEAEKEALVADRLAAERMAEKHQEAAKQCEVELANYKARAHSLLKSKEAELRAVRDSIEAATNADLAEARAAAQQAQQEIQTLRQELGEAEANANEALQEVEGRYEQTVAELRDAADEAGAAADTANQNVEQWRRRYEALEARMETLRAEKRQLRDPPPQLMQKHADEIAALERQLAALQDEFAGFKDTAEQIAEAKDADLERVLGVNASLRDQITVLQSQGRRDTGGEVQMEEVSSREQGPSPWDNLPSQAAAQPDDGRMSFYSAGSLGASGSFANNLGMLSRREDVSKAYQDDGWTYSEGRAPSEWGFGLEPSGLQESNLLRLAEQQAKREEELNGARRQVTDLEAEVADLVREMELRQEQEAALKEALREVERERARASLADKQRMDIEYLKNIILKLYETGEAPALLPAVSMLLHFSPAEVKRCQDALARQAESLDEGASAGGGSTATADGDVSSYLGGWASWAMGEPAS